MAAWDWNHGAVLAGTDVNVNVDAAPCRPVTVTLLVGGQEVDSGQISGPPGSVRLAVPKGSEGKAYEIIVSCNGQSDSQSGTVG